MTASKKRKATGTKGKDAQEKKQTKKTMKKVEEPAEDMELGDAPETPVEEDSATAAEEEEVVEKKKATTKKASSERAGKKTTEGGKVKKSKKAASKEVEEDAEMKEDEEEEEEEDPLSAGASVVPLKTGKKGQVKESDEQRVVYVGRLPTGFEEKELRSFFEQFGDVVAVTLGRSKKTGGSQHFGFVEFKRADVAQIAAAAMNHYFLDHRRLEVSMADEHVRDIHERHIPRPGISRTAKKDVDTRPPKAASRHSDRVNEALEKRVNAARTKEGAEAVKTKLLRAQARRAQKLEKAGVKGFSVPEPKRV